MFTCLLHMYVQSSEVFRVEHKHSTINFGLREVSNVLLTVGYIVSCMYVWHLEADLVSVPDSLSPERVWHRD